MDLKTLPRHRYTHSPLTVLGYRKNGQPIFPIAGAEDQTPEEKAAAEKAAADKAAADAAAAGKSDTGEALDENGKGLGFPADTPTEQMTEAQRTAYWRNMAKIKQREADKVKDYDAQKADAEKWRAMQAEQQTPSEKAIAEAKLEGKKEASRDSALASLRAILSSRGKSESDVAGLVDYLSPDRFLASDGSVDHQKVTAYANTIAPAGSPQGGDGFGQGRYQQPNQSRSAAGKAEAEKRFGKKS